MSTLSKSRWADDEEDKADEARRKHEKNAKRRAKAEKQRKLDEERQNKEDVVNGVTANGYDEHHDTVERPLKRRKVTPESEAGNGDSGTTEILRFPAPVWGPCRHVGNFEKLNHIEEGSYGWVSRAKETATGEVVALKKLKMDNLNDGFPVTGLREIQTLQASNHANIVALREVVMGDKLDEVFLVMDFLEHDLKTLQEDMLEPFLPSETKTLLLQLASAVEYLHNNWILHRDLKTSNILMNNRGQIKIADFGMARYYGDPPPKLTQLVVTLWYRAPEMLLGAEKYGADVDIWSLGCIFGELLAKQPLLQGKNEVDQLTKVRYNSRVRKKTPLTRLQIFELCGIPSEATWPGFKRLPNARSLRLPSNNPRASGAVIRAKFPLITAAGNDLLSSLLSLNPAKRPGAAGILAHEYFKEDPRPKSTALFPTFPSKANQEKRRRMLTPEAPKRGQAPKIEGGDVDFSGIFANREQEQAGGGFSLRLM
ncbi:uncharacterized protein KY384_005476 [Bacidia gigantensis]|uniref:uncharacterized protein n=1 Tax=Bacidia gigantensis TaxID=2732470 RepID=UPI001D048641|nr:uncharacterized protein KY384_005476 [Bacidia gigantensis]KAG8529994.1 hypothetical protein KY384_005476 [Bacidia gigantensis]